MPLPWTAPTTPPWRCIIINSNRWMVYHDGTLSMFTSFSHRPSCPPSFHALTRNFQDNFVCRTDLHRNINPYGTEGVHVKLMMPQAWIIIIIVGCYWFVRWQNIFMECQYIIALMILRVRMLKVEGWLLAAREFVVAIIIIVDIVIDSVMIMWCSYPFVVLNRSEIIASLLYIHSFS